MPISARGKRAMFFWQRSLIQNTSQLLILRRGRSTMTHNQLLAEVDTFREAADKMLRYAHFDVHKIALDIFLIQVIHFFRSSLEMQDTFHFRHTSESWASAMRIVTTVGRVFNSGCFFSKRLQVSMICPYAVAPSGQYSPKPWRESIVPISRPLHSFSSFILYSSWQRIAARSAA